MNFGRYIILLLLLGFIEMFSNFTSIYLKAQPELFFLIAYLTALHIQAKYIIPVFFISGLICDFFTGQHLGMSTFLYVFIGIFLLNFFVALHGHKVFIQFSFLFMSLAFLLTAKVLLLHFAMPSSELLQILGNNIMFTLLLAPACSIFLDLPVIRPWKKREY